MKIKMHCVVALLFLVVRVQAQELRTVKSGDWTDVSIWEKKTDNNWIAANEFPKQNTNVTIKNQHTIVLKKEPVFLGCSNLTIEKGGVLRAEGASIAFNLASGKNTNEFQIINNGTIDSGTEASEGTIVIVIPNTAKKVTFSGAGSTKLGRLQARGNNPNKPEVIIDTDITITEKVLSPNFSAMDGMASRRSNNDDVTFTINKGKTVKIEGESRFHSAIDDYTEGGKYTYNINGKLDLSSLQGPNHFVAVSRNPTSELVLNVKGTVVLGKMFNIVNKDPISEDGKVFLNILDGGVVDATLTKRLNLGTTQFKIEGSGVLKR